MISLTKCAVVPLVIFAVLLIESHGQGAKLLLRSFGRRIASQGDVYLLHNGAYGVSLHNDANYPSDETPNIFKVACRMAGFRGHATSLYRGKYLTFREWSIAYFIKNCSGSEVSLLDCTHTGPEQWSGMQLVRLSCGYPSDKIELVGLTNQSSTSNDSSSGQTIRNEDVNSCFTTKREKNPWLEVSIKGSKYIHTITVVLRNSSSNLLVEVLKINSSEIVKCKTVTVMGREYTVRCDMWFNASTIKIGLRGENIQLGLCRIDVFAMESLEVARGTYLQGWDGKPKDKGSIIKFDSNIKKNPNELQFLPAFDIMNADGLKNRDKKRFIVESTLKQEAYVRVTIEGTYSLGVACKVDCEVWFKRVGEPGLSDPGTEDELLIKYGASPLDNKYELSEEQSKQVLLSICHFYHVDLYTDIGEFLDKGFTNMAVKFPGGKEGEWEVATDRVKKLYYWTKTGSRDLHFTVTSKVTNQINLASRFEVEAVYKFCCKGLQGGCPACPLSLKMHIFDKTIGINNNLEMNCQDHNITYGTNVIVQPANYSLKISYSFVNDISKWEETRTIINTLQVTVSVIYSCAFDSIEKHGLCSGWKVTNKPTVENISAIRRAVMKRDAVRGGYYALRYLGESILESEKLPWTDAYKEITLCVLFSYLLPTETQSNLKVFIKRKDTETLVWSVEGYQGKTWDRARVPLRSQKAFQVVFKSRSMKNNVTTVAIRNFEVSTAGCDFRPTYAKPVFQCKITQFQCKNKHCVDKKYRCNGDDKDSCIDGSDEAGCVCSTGFFTCPDNQCIPIRNVCDGKQDCNDGEDERRCDLSCKGHQCFDGGCVTGSCSSRVCEDSSHLFSKCKYCKSTNIETCGDQLSAKCQKVSQGVCGFNNGPCGLRNSFNSTLRWIIYTPAGKDGYPSYDHSMQNQGSFYLLEPTGNHKGFSTVAMKWNSSVSYCFQFWYIIPESSDSSLEIRFESLNGQRTHLLRMSKGATNDWLLGQVTIPGNLDGELQIIGYVNRRYVALDDLNFIEGTSCPTIDKPQGLSNCYFDNDQPCPMTINEQWKRESGKLQTVYKQTYKQDSYLKLPQTLSLSKTKITSPLLHPKVHNLKCLRFWVYSGEAYLSRSVEVLFVSNDTTKMELTYGSISDKWRYVQLPLPRNVDNLRIIVQGSKDSGAALALDEITLSKFDCQKIPALGEECRMYKNLQTYERRHDIKKLDGSLTDETLTTTDWYRIGRAAGNQMFQKCVSLEGGCSAEFRGWLNGTVPSVEEGQVERKICIVHKTNCCIDTPEVTIRNCSGFYVYKLPDYAHSRPHTKYCSFYNHELYVKRLNIATEWRDWQNKNNDLQWKILSENQLQSISRQIGGGSLRGTNTTSDIEFLNGSASFSIQLKGELKTLTVCLWLSTNATSVNLELNIDNSLASPPNVTLTKDSGASYWRHVCFTWKSDFGVVQFYVDGVATMDTKTGLLDLQILKDPALAFSFTSNNASILGLNSLNIWNSVLDDIQILYMSYVCTSNGGNLLNWEDLLKHNFSDIKITAGAMSQSRFTSCIGKEGNVLGLTPDTNTPTIKIATFESPLYDRSSESSTKCLRFRYKLWGPGARALKLHQLIFGLPRRLLWIDSDNSSRAWRDGQVTLSGLADYKIILQGETSFGPGLLSIGALSAIDGQCHSLPASSSQVCNEILTANTGYVISPYYPSYYSNKAKCTWTIKAWPGHVIRLDFKEFELEMSPRCEHDYLEVYDGIEALPSSYIGRFCGQSYPPIIQSTSNNLHVVFKTNADVVRSGFISSYRIIKAEQNSSDCVQDCPSDCVCELLPNQGIVVSSSALRSVPERLPKDSLAILFYRNTIFQLEAENFYDLPRLEYIDLSFNNILTIEKKSIINLPSLKVLRLNRNYIRKIEDGILVDTRLIHSIDFGENLITSVAEDAFSNLQNLYLLSLRSNAIDKLDTNIFQNNTIINYLYLHENKISSIPDFTFRNQGQLKTLTLHSNKLTTFYKLTFTGLKSLENLTLHNNSIRESSIPQDVFNNFDNLKHLSLDSFILCCYATKAIPGLTCDSDANVFSSCEDMLKKTIIRAGIWIQALLATFGNISVIIWWTLSRDRNGKKSGKADVQSFLLTNLAMADFLMGIYLMIIAIQDAIFKGSYFKHDVDWRSGITCQIAGGISTLSSEVSMMMLVAMTADRFNTIMFDFRAKRLGIRGARALCTLVWIVGFIVAFIPVFFPRYFSDEKSGFTFFGRSTVCLPFQLTSELTAGWEYSVGIFIGFNGIAILFIFIAYTMIFFKVQKSSKSVRNSRTKSSSLGRRVVFVVMTDFCCWMPVIVIGILSLAGSYTDRTGTVYAWIAVFVLPVNSSINPILYTFSTPQVIKKLKSIGKPSSGHSRSHSSQGASTQHTILKPNPKPAAPRKEKLTANTRKMYENPSYEPGEEMSPDKYIDDSHLHHDTRL